MESSSEKTYSEILGLIKAISESGLDEVVVENGYKIKVKRQQEVQIQQVTSSPMQMMAPSYTQLPASPAPAASVVSTPLPVAASTATETPVNQTIIRSSMVGTFYRSPSPADPSYVNEGDMVKVGQVVGIIEAMKLFNEIESEYSGKLVKILVENATPVEFDQALFILEN
jgi:acetyl-CoA carboxylase biotin carboxyl carrier protein